MAKKKFQWVAGEAEEGFVEQGRGRSAAKRKHRAIEAFAGELLDTPDLWTELELSDEMVAALEEGCRLKARGGRAATALRRHLRHLATLLRREESEALLARLPS